MLAGCRVGCAHCSTSGVALAGGCAAVKLPGRLLHACMALGPLPVHLACFGTARQGAECTRLLVDSPWLQPQVLNMGCFILNAVASVRRAGDAVAASAGGGGAATPTLAAVLQAHAGMQQAFPVDDGVQVCVYRIDGELLSRIAGMLPACVQLAAALMAHWREPDQLAASKLEAAQAAAARSCAFLRCASLGGESGPAARQGGFSQRCRQVPGSWAGWHLCGTQMCGKLGRGLAVCYLLPTILSTSLDLPCRACSVAWYCGTACSHANWRAGHRRLCKALGAARQAEKEQRRQAGQPPAG